MMLTLTNTPLILLVTLQLYVALSYKLSPTIESPVVRSSGKNLNDLFDDNQEQVIRPRLLQVEGSIPPYVKGMLVRNGPSVFGALPSKTNDAPRRYTHIFDGLAKLSKYEFKGDGDVMFSTRFIESDWYKRIVRERKDIPPSITVGAVKPPFSLLQNIQGALFSASQLDNACVNVHQVGGSGGHVVAVTDAPFLIEFDLDTLKTVGKVKYPNSITSSRTGTEMLSTAHPHSIKGDSYSYNYYLELKPLSKHNLAHIVRTDKEFNRQVVGTVAVEGVPYIHDFSLTEKYAILFVYPIRSDLSTAASGKGFLPQLQWDGKDKKTKIYIFDIEQSRNAKSSLSKDSEGKRPIAYFETDPVFSYHHINAFEEDDPIAPSSKSIVLDLTAYEDDAILTGPDGYLYIANIKDPMKRNRSTRAGICHRYRIPTQNTSQGPFYIKPQVLHARDEESKYYEFEMVTINPNYKGKPYRYSYGVTMFPGGLVEDPKRRPSSDGPIEWSIVKQDHSASKYPATQNSETTHDAEPSAHIWSAPNCYPSEAVFVPNPDVHAQLEDDGVLLSQVYDGDRQEAFLLVLNALTMQEVARAYTGVRVSVSFHGQFFPK